MPSRLLTVDWRGLRLAGSLHLPPGPAPVPAVVLLAGSGPADRASGGFFRPIREAFLRCGVATFAFDKPGCGRSSGDWRSHNLGDRADQAAAVLLAVRRESGIDPDRVGVWGHSQGGWVVQQLAGADDHADWPAPAFAVINSGPTIGVPAQDLYGCEHTMRLDGRTASEIEAALALTRAVLQAARDGADFPTVAAQLLGPVERHSWYQGYRTITNEADWHHLQLLVTEGFDPLPALRRIRCPVLALYGGGDPLVPAYQSATETGAALAEGGQPRRHGGGVSRRKPSAADPGIGSVCGRLPRPAGRLDGSASPPQRTNGVTRRRKPGSPPGNRQ